MIVLRRRLLAALIAGIPLIFLPGLSLDTFNVPKLTLLAMGIGVMLFLWGVETMGSGRVPVLRSSLIPVAALVVPLTVSWVLSDYRGWTLWGEHGRSLGLISYVLAGLLALLVADAFRGAVRELVITIAISGSLVALYLIIQSVGLDPFWKPGDAPYPPSSVGHFNFAGGFIAFCLPATMWLWLSGEGRWRFLGAASTAVMGCGLILSFSQGSWAAAVASAAVTASYVGSERGSWIRKLGWVIASGIAAVTVGSVLLSGIVGLDALATARTRAVLWESALEMAVERPLAGHGPNAYLIQGNGHRSVTEGLTTEAARADDPHSIPLAMLANGGALAFLGFLLIAYWAITNALRATRLDAAGVALLGCVVSYLVQALVTIDVPTLRVGFWSVIGGIAAAVAADRSVRVLPKRVRIAVAAPVAILGVALAVATIPFYLVPDIKMHDVAELTATGDFEDAIPLARGAIRSRDEPDYRVRLIDAYGFAAREAGTDGRPFIDEAIAASSFLETLPYTLGHYATGHALHQWAYFEDSVEEDALAHFEEALRLDPSYVTARAETAESLIVLERVDEAIDVLEPAIAAADGRYPELSGIYSIALLVDGDIEGARSAAEEGLRTGSGCRPMLAEELLRVTTDDDADPPTESFLGTAGFRCGRGEMYFFARIVPDELADEYLSD